VVPYGLPDADSRLVIGSEVAAMACLTGLGIAAATAVVRRRHPY
jgi:hypothetical protein